MEYRRLGASGVRVSEIGLGSWLTYGVGVEADLGKACVARAYELGVNLFDTADVYGRGTAEEVVGDALCDVPRSSYVLATKVYFPVGDGPNDRGLSRKHIVEQCHASLRRLRTDYLDLYQCHRYDDAAGRRLDAEVLAAVDKAVAGVLEP
ncbi:MAG TPA: aldo/keto reductase [Actinomycetes bacterium]|nr:aldo/keto reductase [Actinomycetes bacterium]